MVFDSDSACLNNPAIIDNVIDDQFTILEFIGAGGMSCVYRVEHKLTQKQFALKLLHEQFFSNSNMLVSFRREARLLTTLKHGNLVPVHGFHIGHDYVYILMRCIQGQSLQAWLKDIFHYNQTLPLDDVLRIVAQVARALDHLHCNGIIHRDVKSGNILIDEPSGTVYVTDLGIAAAGSTDNQSVGTRAYMAPEQQELNDIPVSTRSDLYALGIVTFELLAGKRPFVPGVQLTSDQAELDLIRQHRESPVPSVTDRRPELPTEVNAILKRALAKHPDDRYPTAIEFLNHLHAALIPVLSSELYDLSNARELNMEMLSYHVKHAQAAFAARQVMEDHTPTEPFAVTG